VRRMNKIRAAAIVAAADAEQYPVFAASFMGIRICHDSLPMTSFIADKWCRPNWADRSVLLDASRPSAQGLVF
jgi:hypothetical protein